MVITTSRPEQSVDQSAALDRLLVATKPGMDKVNALVLERAQSHVDMVPDLARYLIDSGGKRLRPMLTIASAEMFGDDDRNAVLFAAAVEFMHTATLLHDDVVDESDMRRGKPAARKVWGNQASVLVGDFLLGQAFLMMVESGDMEALGVLAKSAAVIAEGEVFQLAKAMDFDTSVADYHAVITGKTAALFEAATEVGAMAGGAPDKGRKALALYGLELGRAFQLVDDALDYGGAAGVLGKNTGDDLREGKMTLPIILSLQAGNEQERALIKSALGNPDSDAEKVVEIVAIMQKYDALNATAKAAETARDKAQEALAALPESTTKTLLVDIADYCVSRIY